MTEMAGSEKQLTSFFIEDILSMKAEKRRTSSDLWDDSSETEQTTEKPLSLEFRTSTSHHTTGNIARTSLLHNFQRMSSVGVTLVLKMSMQLPVKSVLLPTNRCKMLPCCSS